MCLHNQQLCQPASQERLCCLTSTNQHRPAWTSMEIHDLFMRDIQRVFPLLFSAFWRSLSLFFREKVQQVQVELRFHLKAERASQRSLDIPRMSLFSSLLLSLFLSRLNENVRSRQPHRSAKTLSPRPLCPLRCCRPHFHQTETL